MYDIKVVTSKLPTACGPCCLKMLLDYYGKEVSLDDLIKECEIDLKGCSAANISRVGKAHGLDMISFKMDAEELVVQDRPAIVWWKYNHFVIFCGLDDNSNVIIANPSRGRFSVSQAFFKSLYSGISLWNGEPHELLK